MHWPTWKMTTTSWTVITNITIFFTDFLACFLSSAVENILQYFFLYLACNILTKSSLSHISSFSLIFNTFLLTVRRHKLCAVKLKQFFDLLKANSKTCHLLPAVKNTCQSIYVSVSPFNSHLSKEIWFSDFWIT